jgi:flagellar protein FlaG
MKTDVAKLALPRPAGEAVAAARLQARGAGAPLAEVARQAGEAAAAAGEAEREAATAVAEANERLAEKGSELTIEFDDALGRTIFKLVDSQTGDVVRQIPSEEVIAISRALKDQVSTGVLLRSDA